MLIQDTMHTTPETPQYLTFPLQIWAIAFGVDFQALEHIHKLTTYTRYELHQKKNLLDGTNFTYQHTCAHPYPTIVSRLCFSILFHTLHIP